MNDTDDSAPDRYKSFHGIDCEGNSRKLLECVQRHIQAQQKPNVFWKLFQQKIEESEDPQKPDALRLICSNVYYIEELLEDCEDEEGLELLQQVETDCC